MRMRAVCRAAPAYERAPAPTPSIRLVSGAPAGGCEKRRSGYSAVVTSSQPFRIEQVASPAGSGVVISVHGEIDYFTVASLRLYVRSLATGEIVIRLHDLSFCDSSGLALLLELKAPDRSVRFEGISGQVRETLERTGTLAAIEA